MGMTALQRRQPYDDDCENTIPLTCLMGGNSVVMGVERDAPGAVTDTLAVAVTSGYIGHSGVSAVTHIGQMPAIFHRRLSTGQLVPIVLNHNMTAPALSDWPFLTKLGTATTSRRHLVVEPAAGLIEQYQSFFATPSRPAEAPILPQAIAKVPLNVSATIRVRRLASIQAAFALSLLDLAKILHLSRTQLYRWIDEDCAVDIRRESAQRLGTVQHLADFWTSLSTTPLADMRQEPLADGQTIIDRLAAQSIDKTQVESAFRILASRSKDRPRTLSEQLREKGYKPQPRWVRDDE